MKLAQFLVDFLADESTPARGASADLNLDWLKCRIAQGYAALTARPLAAGTCGLTGPGLILDIALGDRRESVPVGLGLETILYLRSHLGAVAMAVDPARAGSASGAASGALVEELKQRFVASEALPAEERAATLMDWITERIAASRCALVPCEGGIPTAPLVFHMRGDSARELDPRHVPRRVLAHVARTRQPLVSHDVAGPGNALAKEATLREQQVRSFMAVPIVFRGELLAVCYVDRLDRPRRFTAEEQASFEAFSYELALPLLALRDEVRRRDFRALRDAVLTAGAKPWRLATSPALAPILEQARRLAPYAQQNLLIVGETGVGKEVVARVIHDMSGRDKHPFVAVNLSAVPAELFESELMGSTRGAFTDAIDRAGRICEAEGGTLFLDEIGDLSLLNQVKLLRFLEDKRLRALGGRDERVVDVRILAATNRDLDRLVQEGEFRVDLYHRFAPPLRVPPLRDRREEILPHARDWLELQARCSGLPVPALSDGAESLLVSHAWPGNVRQLEMVLSHALLLSDGPRIGRQLLASLLGPPVEAAAPAARGDAAPATWEAWRRAGDSAERTWLAAVLERHRGNVEAAGRAIACPASTLRSALRRHGIPFGRS